MKVKYKGFQIEVNRETSLAGYKMIYFRVFRISDGLFIVDDFEDSIDSLKTYVEAMKQRVDEFIETKGKSENLSDFYSEGVCL